ncbi:MAG: hypothetical protein LBJ08_10225, partial [Bifidobacteriaceae bacterium]|nr:hypothetical protein [Bifidobacteriaceae bacterium]
MVDMLTCPLCGGEHPLGTTWCPVLLAEIPAGASAAPAQAPGAVQNLEPATGLEATPELPSVPV